MSATQTVTVSASYTSGGVTRTASRTVSIVNVPGPSPAAPGNMTISGPVTSPPSETWRLSWEPVTTYLSGAPIEAGRSVRYIAYWTRDPLMAQDSLLPLASSITATSIVFSPAANGMIDNERVYFTAVAVLSDTGDPSSPAAEVAWVVSNRGPSAPGRGSIKKK
ncbi:MAG: hypothetical protein C4529_07010 [Deltaproteobacteria bacterium]|nr:MAG: hypothetical protein C4529_07010 [Deltaproteobacteria bacterium]